MVWRPNVTVAAVVEKNGKFLMVEESSQGSIVLNQPAGHLEADESLLDAVVRETLEETGWCFRPDALVGIYRWVRPRRNITFLRFAFSGELTGQESDGPLDDAILGTRFMDTDELKTTREQHRSPQVLACLEDYLAGQRIPLSCLRDFP
ncbi:MAG: NUDIX hydrolase [Gammaproteobacteria bacterium]|nr:NUDIX hydrolase [Gammaproteobacteria bacterium]